MRPLAAIALGATVFMSTRAGSAQGPRPPRFEGGSLEVLSRADSIRFWNTLAGGPLHGRVASHARILSADGFATTSRYVVERVDRPANMYDVIHAFATAETSGREFGSVISTRDTVRATIGAARIEIDYSRPKVRRRAVFKHGVLGDTLWRAGANAATALRTNADIRIGGQLVPAGAGSNRAHRRNQCRSVTGARLSHRTFESPRPDSFGRAHHRDESTQVSSCADALERRLRCLVAFARHAVPATLRRADGGAVVGRHASRLLAGWALCRVHVEPQRAIPALRGTIARRLGAARDDELRGGLLAIVVSRRSAPRLRFEPRRESGALRRESGNG